MAKNVLQSTILSGAGAVAIAPGAQIEVRNPSGLLVPLWLDRDGTQEAGNPVYADSDGFFRVYLNSGRYHITARSGAESREWRDVLLGSAAGYDVDDMLAALAAGIYTSVAEGLANTAEGDFFWVAHETGEDVLTLYRVVDGEAELWASLPRGDVVREAAARAEAAAESAEEDAQAAQDALDAILALGDLPSAVAAAEQAAQSASDSATAAATSASTASTAATAAEQAAQRAEDAAADTGLPSPIVPDTFLQAKADGSGYQAITLSQMLDFVVPIGGEIFGGSEPGSGEPPQSHFICLTAGLTGPGQYNEGKLRSESVTGSAPLITATAIIDDPESPLYGETVHLINTERRFQRPGTTGATGDDALQNITGSFRMNTSGAAPSGVFAFSQEGNRATGAEPGATVVSFDASRVARTADETRPRYIERPVYKRIK